MKWNPLGVPYSHFLKGLVGWIDRAVLRRVLGRLIGPLNIALQSGSSFCKQRGIGEPESATNNVGRPAPFPKVGRGLDPW